MPGQDPESGLAVVLKAGRFGTYLQLGEGSKEEKPKRSSIPKGIDAATVDLELALKLLSLPRDVGVHPDTQQPIIASLGQYGPYVKHERTYANLPNWDDLFTIGINHAVSLIADKVAGKGSRFGRAVQKQVLKELGDHPEGGKIEILDGKYGPYISHNKVNANVPKGKEPTAVTMQEAIELLAARAEKGGGKKGRKAPAKKAAAKKTDKPAKSAKAAKGAKKDGKAKETKSAEC